MTLPPGFLSLSSLLFHPMDEVDSLDIRIAELGFLPRVFYFGPGSSDLDLNSFLSSPVGLVSCDSEVRFGEFFGDGSDLF